MAERERRHLGPFSPGSEAAPGPRPDAGYPPGYLPPAERIRRAQQAQQGGYGAPPGRRPPEDDPGWLTRGRKIAACVILLASVGVAVLLGRPKVRAHVRDCRRVAAVALHHDAILESASNRVLSGRNASLSRAGKDIDRLMDAIDLYAMELEAAELSDPGVIALREKLLSLIDEAYLLLEHTQVVLKRGECDDHCVRSVDEQSAELDARAMRFDGDFERYCGIWASWPEERGR